MKNIAFHFVLVMAGDVVNIKGFSMLKLRSRLTEKKPVMSHDTYNLPFAKIIL